MRGLVATGHLPLWDQVYLEELREARSPHDPQGLARHRSVCLSPTWELLSGPGDSVPEGVRNHSPGHSNQGDRFVAVEGL